MSEAERKRGQALAAAGGGVVTSRPADVRWLLCDGHGLEETPPALDALRLELQDAELDRYRAAGAEVADAMRRTLLRLSPELSELNAAGELALETRRRGFTRRTGRRASRRNGAATTRVESQDGLEVLIRTADLGELDTAGLPRPAIVQL